MLTEEPAPLRLALERACYRGDLDAVVRLVVEHGAAAVRLDADVEELTALHLAAHAGHDNIVKYLLSEAVRADPAAAHGNAFTPLHAAAMDGNTVICGLLLQAGAKVDAQTEPQGYTALHSAAFAGHFGTVRLLLSHSADRTLLNYRGETPADTARRTGKQKVVEVLELPGDALRST